MGKTADRLSEALGAVDKAWQKAAPYAKTALHWGFIPTIIVLGCTITEPRPSLAQLLGPM